jgi:lambda family phage portal protein
MGAILDWFLGRTPAKSTDFTPTYGNGNTAGFAGGHVNRLTASLATWSGAVNYDLDGSIVVMRARARALAQSNEYGRRFLSQVASNVVGRTGPKLQVRAYRDQLNPKVATTLDKAANDAVEIHWQRWGKSADIGGRMDLPHFLRTAAKAVARDGETLVRIVRNKKLPYGIALQLLEADRLDERLNQILPNGAIRQGVEIDSTGRAVAYWIKSAHPGDRYTPGSTQAERVLAGDIKHLFLQERAEQVRGYTWFHAILLRAAQLHGYNEAAVLAARIGASKIAALERAEDGADLTASMADGQIGGIPQMNIEAGELFELPPGYKMSSWNPEYPTANYESFVKTALRGISAGLDVATHNLSGDMTDVNYSSARIAELAERDIWMVLQDWLINAIVEPIYQEWLALALLRGDITFDISGKSLPADKYAKFANASRFQGRRWRWVDPSKEMTANTDGVSLGVTSRTRIAAEQGEDFDDLLDELKQENEALKAAGLQPTPAPKAQPEPLPDPLIN